ncbi:MAG: DUF1160 domain-containing protein, partial [Paraprevotella sp.]|nr:DUF1160 domain-containing protein [Paraprevotella sp.]
GSNIKRKMSRFTYSACTLFFVGGALVACQDDLLTGTPSWLGSSIYEELEKRGNYLTTLDLINDASIQQKDVLSLTGSKTLFVADDDAYARFFSDNPWGVKSYSELSDAQKKLLFNSSMINSAYLIELMSSVSNGSADPLTGACLRRVTSLSLYDTIPQLTAKDMPQNSYWKPYRAKYPDGGKDKMLVLRDNTVSPMVHFLPAVMSNNSITDDDLNFLTNGKCTSISESYINGQRLTDQDITCQNGYIQVVENVMTPLTNMAEAIREDADLSTFSKMLDRFSVPVFDQSTTNSYNAYNTSGQVDSVFTLRYFNSGCETNSTSYDALTSYAGTDITNLLPYDPGWNEYANGASGVSMSRDMGVIIAPTNEAFDRYFQSGGGKSLIDYFHSVDSIPDHIILDMLDNYMKYSLLSAVPSKFSSVTNSAQFEMGLSKGEPGGTTGIASCIMANNGVVYKSNEVYAIPEYQSVAFPASLDDAMLIMRYMISDLNYDAYLNSMESEYIFILPTDEALANYVDPVDYQKTQKTITEFYYDNSAQLVGNRIKCRRYNAIENADGSLSKGSEITNPWSSTMGYTSSSTTAEADYVENRLKDVLENSIFVKDKAASASSGKNVWVSMGGCPIIMEGSGEGVKIITPYRKEIKGYTGANPDVLTVRDGDGYYNMGSNPNGNGETFIVNKEPVLPATKSVPTILGELSKVNDEYSEFYQMLNNSDLISTLYDVTTGSSTDGTKSAKTISNGNTINIMDNYNYTIYVPPTSEIKKLYTAHLLPDWRDVIELDNKLDDPSITDSEAEKIQAQVDSMTTLIDNFLRYHIQNNAVYLAGPSSSSTYETSYVNGGRFASLSVSNTGTGNAGSITITCRDAQRNEIEGESARRVMDGNYFAREYHFRTDVSSNDNNSDSSQPRCTDISKATRIYNSSTAVIHLIDKPLLYTQSMSDAYNAIAGN